MLITCLFCHLGLIKKYLVAIKQTCESHANAIYPLRSPMISGCVVLSIDVLSSISIVLRTTSAWTTSLPAGGRNRQLLLWLFPQALTRVNFPKIHRKAQPSHEVSRRFLSLLTCTSWNPKLVPSRKSYNPNRKLINQNSINKFIWDDLSDSLQPATTLI